MIIQIDEQHVLKDSTKHNLPQAQSEEKTSQLDKSIIVSETPRKKCTDSPSSLKYLGNFVFEVSKKNSAKKRQDSFLDENQNTPSTAMNSEFKAVKETELQNVKNTEEAQPMSVRKELVFSSSTPSSTKYRGGYSEQSKRSQGGENDERLFSFRERQNQEAFSEQKQTLQQKKPKIIEQPKNAIAQLPLPNTFYSSTEILPNPCLLQTQPFLIASDMVYSFPYYQTPLIMPADLSVVPISYSPQIVGQTKGFQPVMMPPFIGQTSAGALPLEGNYSFRYRKGGYFNNFRNEKSHSCETRKKADLPEIISLKLGLPPKAPSSPFKLYLTERRLLQKKENTNENRVTFAQISNEWHHVMSYQNRKPYYEKAKEEAVRYEAALKDYDRRKELLLQEHKSKRNMVDAEKDAGSKLKFKSAFKLFKLDKIVVVKENNPEAGFRERIKIIKEMWRNLPVPEKSVKK